MSYVLQQHVVAPQGHHDNNIDLQQFAVTKQKEEF